MRPFDDVTRAWPGIWFPSMDDRLYAAINHVVMRWPAGHRCDLPRMGDGRVDYLGAANLLDAASAAKKGGAE